MWNEKKLSAADWEIFPDELIHTSPIMKLRQGLLQHQKSGRQKNFYLFDFPDWVNVVALTPRRQILLIRQFRYGSKKVEIEIPGGMVEHLEDPIVAGCRELLEETGYAGENARIIGKVCPNPAIQANFCHTVLVENTEKIAQPRFDDMEEIECAPFAEKDVWALIKEGRIDHGLVLNALMFYREISG